MEFNDFFHAIIGEVIPNYKNIRALCTHKDYDSTFCGISYVCSKCNNIILKESWLCVEIYKCELSLTLVEMMLSNIYVRECGVDNLMS
jgi:hypothetical protein